MLGDKFFNSTLAEVRRLTEADIRAAWEVFRKFEDKDWSFTDCASYAVMERLGINKAFAFDHHFKQFGSTLSSLETMRRTTHANLHADASRWEREIDRLVYQLYELTEDEISIVKGASAGH